jgi:D-amino peptidase
MKVYLSVDMEGLAGVSHDAPTGRHDIGYPAVATQMVAEANAAIDGAFAGGATEVLVNDSHWEQFNLIARDLDRRAVLLQGQKPWSMVQGAGPDKGFSVALCVGYHARAGHPRGTLAHTFSFWPTLVRINGRAAGETAFVAMALGAWGVPVGMVSGDDALADEVADWLPRAERVVVKEGVSWRAAASVHPTVACERIREASERAVRGAAAGELELLDVGSPVVVEVEYGHAGQADLAAMVPGVERDGDRGTRFNASDAITAYRGFVSQVGLAREGSVVE